MLEQWRDVPGYGGAYLVSDQGRVWSHRSRTYLTGGTSSGYPMVCLRRAGRNRTELRHRLVLLAFVGPAPTGTQACHRNGDKSNPALTNLRWDSASENTLDQVRHGTHHHARVTVCPAGHPYDAANTFVRPNGKRDCIACRRAASARFRARARGVTA